MSRANIQSLSLLAISAGAVKTIQDHCIISRVDCKQALEEAYQKICEGINQWPETGNGHKNTKQIEQNLRQWSEIEYAITPHNKTAVLLSACERAMVDLLDRLHNKRCKGMIEAILEPLRKVWAVYGKDGAFYSVWDESAVMVEQLQKTIQW